jgi:5-methylcytosine-specific restriction protein A
MALRDTLEAVLREYDSAKLTKFAGNPLAEFISKEAVLNIEKAAGPAAVGLLFAGSAGAEHWAEVSWLAAFDPVVTVSATRGYYVVYLFHVSEPIVHLSLNQGTTAVTEEFGVIARQVLSERAALIRKRLPDFLLRLPATQIALGSTAGLPGDYAAAHVLGVTYSLDKLPNEQTLGDDLRSALQAYRALTFRAGWDVEPETEAGGVFEQPQSLTELRQYRLHCRIERNPTATKVAKQRHGSRCQACDVDLGERYGPIGQEYIEAHHLRPISTLEEGVLVRYDEATDFAVLCPNCHRMIHRMEDPSNLYKLRALLH